MPARRARRRLRWTIGLPLLLAALLIGTSYLWLGRFYHVSSASMEPALDRGDRVLVLLTADQPQRGDIVVVDVSATWASAGRDDTRVVKRVIGLPGERVVCCDQNGRVTIDGRPLDEPYLADGLPGPSYDVIVPSGRVWLLGDNRASSRDARDHLGSPGGGTVGVEDVIGRAVAVLWPPVRALDSRAR